ncbi:MAG: XTP/dITP diphosphatase [Clostridiaceae bacterium]|nr:XTP/dITP diphosphatase [Clostridiaceae bacterium]
MRIICATNNKGKISEIKEIFKGTDFEIVSLKEAGITHNTVEDADTFMGNAIKKAKEIYELTKTPALSDDSGLVVDALDGAPGVYSARFAGENATDSENIQKLLKLMEGKTNRAARFECSIALVLSDSEIITATGRCEGEITTSPRGEGGFGYDPVFFVKEYKKTFAEIPMEEKNKISHRARALKELMRVLKEKSII